MLILLTTTDGPALINTDDIHAIVPYIDNLQETDGSDIWWKYSVRGDMVGTGIGDRRHVTFVEESLKEILALLAGTQK
jgi:hypothetical protein